jgi:hypothetical protein
MPLEKLIHRIKSSMELELGILPALTLSDAWIDLQLGVKSDPNRKLYTASMRIRGIGRSCHTQMKVSEERMIFKMCKDLKETEKRWRRSLCLARAGSYCLS